MLLLKCVKLSLSLSLPPSLPRCSESWIPIPNECAAADCSSVNAGEEQFCTSGKFIFLYEDFEGDRILVGDVPWE
jgi:hypothetical protein